MFRLFVILKQILLGDILFKAVPVNKKAVMFTSFFGQHYSDGPRAISERLHELAPAMQIFWCFKPGKQHEIPAYVHAVEMGSVRHLFVKSTAAFIVTNVYQQAGYLSGNRKQDFLTRAHLFLENRKKQSIITTWHGTPLKRMGNNQVNARQKHFICNNPTYYVVGNVFERDIMMRLTENRMIPLLWGSPRSVNIQSVSEEDRFVILNKAGIRGEKNQHVVLYAPTFRAGQDGRGVDIVNSGLNQISQMDFDKLDRLFRSKFGWTDWKMVCRFHNLFENAVDWDELNKRYKGRIINGNKLEDIAEYYKISDIVITDYSSVMFDVMTTFKPVFIFCHDLENYKSNERGFYFNFEYLPFPCAENFTEMLRELEHFDMQDYNAQVSEFMNQLGYVNAPDVLDKICELIVSGGGTV